GVMVSTAIIENVVVITGIRFRPAGRIYYFDPQGQSYTTGQYVIVETVRGVEAGRVVIASKKMAESDLSDPLKPILRLATEDELRMMLSFKSKEKEALVKCAERVAQHALPMKLVESEYTFDGSRLTFYFTADERVDFRALVRDLAAAFRTRIELRQIGARDQAKQSMPQVGAILNTPSGPGKVVSINVPQESVEVMLESGATIQVPVNQSSQSQGPVAQLAEQRMGMESKGGCGSCSLNKSGGGCSCGKGGGGCGSGGCGGGCGSGSGGKKGGGGCSTYGVERN